MVQMQYQNLAVLVLALPVVHDKYMYSPHDQDDSATDVWSRTVSLERVGEGTVFIYGWISFFLETIPSRTQGEVENDCFPRVDSFNF